jgi:hypothetical protein
MEIYLLFAVIFVLIIIMLYYFSTLETLNPPPLIIKSNEKHTENEYEPFCNSNHKIIYIDNYSDLILEEPIVEKPILFRVKNHISKNEFNQCLMNDNLTWTKNGRSNNPVGKMKYSDILTEIESDKICEKYVFDINRGDTNRLKNIETLISRPTASFVNKTCPKSIIYSGQKNTGSHLHNHDYTLNYLVHGKKLWIMFPKNDDFKNYTSTKDMAHFGQNSVIAWFHEDYHILKALIKDLYIFIQNAGEVVFIPYAYLHAVINLETCYGFTYSGDSI